MYDDLVERLRCQLYDNCPACVNCYMEQVEPNLWRVRCVAIDAADAIELLQKTQQPKWIPVTERLPDMKDYDYVLGIVNGSDKNVYFENAVEMVSYDSVLGWFMDDYPNAGIRVTHWMPLPEPPKVSA